MFQLIALSCLICYDGSSNRIVCFLRCKGLMTTGQEDNQRLSVQCYLAYNL